MSNFSTPFAPGRAWRIALAAAGLMALAACGGNSDGDVAPAAQPAAVATTAGTGIAAGNKVVLAERSAGAATVSMTSSTDFNLQSGAPTFTASAPNGTARVEYYSGSTKLGESTLAPEYAFTWTAATPGNHIISALAVYAQGGSAISAAQAVQIDDVPLASAITYPGTSLSLSDL